LRGQGIGIAKDCRIFVTYTSPVTGVASDSVKLYPTGAVTLHRDLPSPLRVPAMPSLFRFLTIVAIIGGLVYGVVFVLANFVTPSPREMTVTIQPDKFLKK
jgi:hypothetical protein